MTIKILLLGAMIAVPLHTGQIEVAPLPIQKIVLGGGAADGRDGWSSIDVNRVTLESLLRLNQQGRQDLQRAIWGNGTILRSVEGFSDRQINALWTLIAEGERGFVANLVDFMSQVSSPDRRKSFLELQVEVLETKVENLRVTRLRLVEKYPDLFTSGQKVFDDDDEYYLSRLFPFALDAEYGSDPEAIRARAEWRQTFSQQAYIRRAINVLHTWIRNPEKGPNPGRP